MMTRQMPTDVNSARGKLVYLYLSTHKSASIDELHNQLNLTHLTLYGLLRTLRSSNYVTKTGDQYKFTPHSTSEEQASD